MFALMLLATPSPYLWMIASQNWMAATELLGSMQISLPFHCGAARSAHVAGSEPWARSVLTANPVGTIRVMPVRPLSSCHSAGYAVLKSGMTLLVGVRYP